jgi:hypothetical protein
MPLSSTERSRRYRARKRAREAVRLRYEIPADINVTISRIAGADLGMAGAGIAFQIAALRNWLIREGYDGKQALETWTDRQIILRVRNRSHMFAPNRREAELAFADPRLQPLAR